jgi:phosphoglucosamine mutase
MGKLFGTDGIRGIVNETLDAPLAYRVGQAAAISLADDTGTKPTVVIGKDTRISSDLLEGALIAGLCACGCNAIRLGVIPTPAVAYLTVCLHADAGIVISASHNPFEHNGIKMFSGEGYKLNDDLEARIEDLILQKGKLPLKKGGELGQTIDGSFAAEYYIDHLASTVESLPPLRVLFDCANGASSATARYLFTRYDLKVRLHQRQAERHEHQQRLRLDSSGNAIQDDPRGRVRPRPGLRRRRRPLPGRG